MRQKSIRRVLCTACAVGAVAAANAEEMYAVDSSRDALYVIDSVTGAVVRTIGPLHPDPARFTTPVAMAVRADGAIFINNNSPAGDDGLARVDPATGLAHFIGGASSQLDQAISFGPGGVLYGTDAAGELARVNQVTGAVTSVGGPALPRLYGLAFRRADGFLYGITAAGPGAIPDLLKIDPATGVAVSTIALSRPIGGSAPGTLVFDSCGTLIGSDNGSNLYDIDPATGVVSSFRSAAASPQGMGRIARCYADCDGSGALDFFDFLCFQDAFSTGECYADCDRSGGLDFFDFLCFQNAFAAGCP